MESRGPFRYVRELFSCRRFSEVTSFDLDRELSKSEWFMLRFHGLYCFVCRRFYRQMQKLQSHCKHVDDWCESSHPEAVLSEERKEQIKRTLESHHHYH